MAGATGGGELGVIDLSLVTATDARLSTKSPHSDVFPASYSAMSTQRSGRKGYAKIARR